MLVFLGLSVLDLGPMYATDRQSDVRHASSLNAPTLGAGYNNGDLRRTRANLKGLWKSEPVKQPKTSSISQSHTYRI